MERKDITQLLAAEIGRIAPDVDLADIDPKADLRDEMDIDSIDFLNLVAALSKKLEISMPEADYHLMDSLDHLIDYIETHVK